MNPWPIRIAVICGMGTAIALWLISMPSYLTACYDFDFACSNHAAWRTLFLFGPPVVGALTGMLLAHVLERFWE